MRLSEAIRLGAMLRPQGFGSLRGCNRQPGTSCALDAAAESLGLDLEVLDGSEPSHYRAIVAQYPFLATQRCPECRLMCDSSPAKVIWHLNDQHRWTREQIADWVETIE